LLEVPEASFYGSNGLWKMLFDKVGSEIRSSCEEGIVNGFVPCRGDEGEGYFMEESGEIRFD